MSTAHRGDYRMTYRINEGDTITAIENRADVYR